MPNHASRSVLHSLLIFPRKSIVASYNHSDIFKELILQQIPILAGAGQGTVKSMVWGGGTIYWASQVTTNLPDPLAMTHCTVETTMIRYTAVAATTFSWVMMVRTSAMVQVVLETLPANVKQFLMCRSAD